MGKGVNVPTDTSDLANIDETELSSNQEAVAVPWFCGERKFALKWISPTYNQFTREAPAERPGKK
jgi:hypothetical protein